MTDNRASESYGLSRRSLFAAGAVGAGALLIPSASFADEEDSYHEGELFDEPDGEFTPMAMVTRSSINGTTLYYEPTGNRASFQFNSTFYNQLVTWRDRIGQYVPSSWNGTPTRLYSYGVYSNRPPSLHAQARAIDIAKVRFVNSSGNTRTMSCRYDVWRNSSDLAMWRRRYWALSASLHHRFRNVLTYLWDSAHHNHIHVDNGVYGRYQNSTFSSGSKAQVQHVQAVCRYLWGHSTTIDGIWGSQTRSHSTSVLRRIGRSSGTILGDTNWRVFNYSSCRKGSGRTSY